MSNELTPVPQPVLELYQRAQVNTAMDCGTYVGGTDQYGVERVIEEIASTVGWELPEPMTYAEMVEYLRAEDREDEIEYLMEMG